MTKQRRYLSYLLRMWQTSDGEEMVWRASVQSPDSKEQHGFANLEELMRFLQEQADHTNDDEPKNVRQT